MTPSENLFARAETIFERIIDATSGEREALLLELCGAEPELLAQVRSLLAAAEEDSTFMVKPALGEGMAVMEAAPTELGDFRILGLLGEGGMGTVYKAEQLHPRREVALKVIRAGMASRQMLRRFELEAETLAQLRHPGIAQIFASGRFAACGLSGQTAEQPYFAMEFIAGKPLDEFAVGRDEKEKLELVAQVADAIAHAHQRGVVHRDLKPGNILVDSSGQPKVLDFGVARITRREGEAIVSDASMATATGQVIGTLAYMSPEQLTGGQVDTRSDVYALGVILYQLLCDRLPHNVTAMPVYEATRTILTTAPVRPSAINPLVRGDVETIVSKAMAHDAAMRYGSAAEFAADIRRFLNHEPITARPASATYQIRMFARRNRLLVGAGAVISLVVVGAAVGMSVLYFQADHQRDLAVAAGQAERTATELERKARELAQREVARTEAVSDFIVRDTFAAANPSRRGHQVKLVEVLEDAVSAAKTRFAADPDILVLTLNQLAESLTEAARYEAARDASQEASRVLAAHPELPARLNYSSIRNQATLEMVSGDITQAERLYREMVVRAEASGHMPLSVLDAKAELAECMQKQGAHAEAQTLLHAILSHALLQPGAGLEVAAARTVLTASNSLAASLLSQGQYEQALSVLIQALDTVKDRLPESSAGVVATMGNVISGKVSQKKGAEVLVLSTELVARSEKIWARGHLNRAAAKGTAAAAYEQAGDTAEQIRLLKVAVEELMELPLPTDFLFERLASNLVTAAQKRGDIELLKFAGTQWMIGRLTIVGFDELQTVAARTQELIKKLKAVDPNIDVAEYFAGIEKNALLRASQVPSRHRRVAITLALMMAETRNTMRAMQLLDIARALPIVADALKDDDQLLTAIADAISDMLARRK